MKESIRKLYRIFVYWNQRAGLDSLFVETLLLILVVLAMTIKFNPNSGNQRQPAGYFIYDNVKPEVKPRIPEHLKKYEY